MPDEALDDFPKLEQAQSLLLQVILDHPRMRHLSIACGPFFEWMKDHAPKGGD